MAVFETWFLNSLIYRFFIALVRMWRQSQVDACLSTIGRVIKQSTTAMILSRFFSKPFESRDSFIYRALQRTNQKTYPLREQFNGIYQHSLIAKVTHTSRAYKLIITILIPVVAWYVFIDELGRNVFQNSVLFGYWDEIYLLICVLYLITYWLLGRDRKPLVSTPLDAPMLLLIIGGIFLWQVNSKYYGVGFEGLRVVVQYLLWYFVVSRFIHSDERAYGVVKSLVWLGGLLGIHGLYQYVARVETPKSWTDMAEGTTATRVFSIVGSPNILGSLMVLFIPLCIALVMQKKRSFNERAIYFLLFGAMGLTLVFTLSRGAWMGMVVAVLVFCFCMNPKWLVPMIFAGSSVLLVPSVANRILYMLSPQYWINSMAGGRMQRWLAGLQLFSQNSLMGVGLGHYGGAVALNHKKDLFPTAISMDNYWLKTAVEMGSVGLILFGLLILFLIIWSIRAVKRAQDYDSKLITAGGFAGMCGIIAHNFGENIFEVPYMVVYFWMIAAVVMYFGFKRKYHAN